MHSISERPISAEGQAMTARALYEALVDAGLKVHQYPRWETRGGRWAMGTPLGQMVHHTAAPVPYPVDRLAGALLKANINTKPDGRVWLIAYGACNYSSGAGSNVVLGEVKAGTPPTANASDRDLRDDTNGNPYFWNSENDHYGKGGPLPEIQEEAITVSTRVVNAHFGLNAGNTISHAEWTRRKSDPYWNGDRRAIEAIRAALKEDDPMLPIEKGDPRDEVVRALKQLLNDTYGTRLNVASPLYDTATVAAVKQHLGRYTGNTDGRNGEWVGGVQWARMLADLAKKNSGSGGVSEAQVKQMIAATRLAP